MHTVQIFGIRRRVDNRCLTTILVIFCMITMILGVLIGRFVTCVGEIPDKPETPKPFENGVCLPGVSKLLMKDSDPKISEELRKNVNLDKIEGYLRSFGEDDGGEANSHVLKTVKKHWETVGLDHVTMMPYDAIVSAHIGNVELVDAKNRSVLQFNTTFDSELTVLQHALINLPATDLYGDLVYVNYGRLEDYEFLEQNEYINVSGKIVIVRYGGGKVEEKIKEAEIRGASCIIVFDEDSSDDNMDQSEIENSIFKTQRAPGFQLSALYTQNMCICMPHIPSLSGGPLLAKQLLSELGGNEVPLEWRGKLNITYRFGNGFPNNGQKLHVRLDSSKSTVTVNNIIGVIKGNIEPDRYVLVGTQRIRDRYNGTAVLLEIIRVMGQLVRAGKWRPRRTIIFSSWDGIDGSRSWIENTKVLNTRLVAYLNLDLEENLGDQSVKTEGTFLMYKALDRAAKKIVITDNTRAAIAGRSMYDTWMSSASDLNPFSPKYKTPTSKYVMSFINYLGVPVVDAKSDFLFSTALGQFIAELARDLSDSPLLPFNLTDYAKALQQFTERLKSENEMEIKDSGVTTDMIDSAIRNFTIEAGNFDRRLRSANLQDPFVIRGLNDQMMQLNKAFLTTLQFPCDHVTRHVLFGCANTSNTAENELRLPNNKNEEGIRTRKHQTIISDRLSLIVSCVQSAIAVLKEAAMLFL